jgi:hypothetical protein
MAGITYFVALPFVAADDGIAAGEPTECFNPNAAVIRAEALSRKEGHVGAVAFSARAIPRREISAMPKSSGSSATCQTISAHCEDVMFDAVSDLKDRLEPGAIEFYEK